MSTKIIIFTKIIILKVRKLSLVLTFLTTLNIIVSSLSCFAQGVAINTTGTSPDPSAMLDISSTNSGILIPRMTKAQRNAINSPAEGLIIYQTNDTIGFWYYNGTKWAQLSQTANNSLSGGSNIGNTLYWDGNNWTESSNILNNVTNGNVGIGTTTPEPSALLDMNSNTKGVLIPRMTTAQRNTIQNATEGLTIYNLDCHNFEYYDGTSWVAVNPKIAGVNISANPSTPICKGSMVTFTATPLNGGTSPTYQWKVNGSNVGTNSNTYTTSSLNNGDQVSCEMISNEVCINGNPATSNVIIMQVVDPPTIADAYDDIISLPTTIYINASYPQIGTGLWSIISGVGGSISNPTSYNTQFTGNPGTTYVLEWTISNPPCPSSSDTKTVTFAPACTIGTAVEGGIAFYNTGNYCYVAATIDQSTGAQWGCQGGTVSGASGTSIGSGPNNTQAIVNYCSTQGIAARICDTLTAGGFSDWFLPSSGELYQMYLEKNNIGNFAATTYWSSSQSSEMYAHGYNFSTGSPITALKSTNIRVRCIRRYP